MHSCEFEIKGLHICNEIDILLKYLNGILVLNIYELIWKYYLINKGEKTSFHTSNFKMISSIRLPEYLCLGSRKQ